MKEGDKILHDGDSFTVQQVFKTGWGDNSTFAFVMVKDVAPKPDIRWERIPDCAFTANVTDRYVYFRDKYGDDIGIFDDQTWKEWFFPNWHYFIGQTFTRPRGGGA